MKYDPERGVQADEWLALDEGERVAVVETFHGPVPLDAQRKRLHATIHTVVENQIALGEAAVVEALARLRDEGLTRHEAVHAIGMAVVEHLTDVLSSQAGPDADVAASYLERLRNVTAAQWRASGESQP